MRGVFRGAGCLFTSVCDGVDTAGGTHAGGEGHGQINIVDDGAGQDLGIAPRRLLPVLRLPENGRHF